MNRIPLNGSTEIRLTRLCTQRCRQCSIYDRTSNPPTMTWTRFKAITAKLKEYGAYIGFISGGEASLVPDLDKILIEAKKTFSLATTLVTGLYNKTKVIQETGRTALENNINIQTSLDGLDELGDSLRGVTDFSKTVLKHMSWIARNRETSRSLLYTNIVMNNLNLDQVPNLVRIANDTGWKTTIGIYHNLTSTTRMDKELQLRPGKRLDAVIKFLDNNSDILNLDSFIKGISDFLNGKPPGFCAFVDAPVFATRTTIMEDGSIHLCHGDPIGNIFENSIHEVFTGTKYKNRIKDYNTCSGCWTTCYSQRYLLVHPKSPRELYHNIKKVRNLKRISRPLHGRRRSHNNQ